MVGADTTTAAPAAENVVVEMDVEAAFAVVAKNGHTVQPFWLSWLV